ncbi:MAG: hypothetical protein KZQ66_19225 [Candidatus Thiodiazotropha sp. (ex Lucinoma aequizonata)]|nr:hypothetical protein [Candidatus Thiodiazotropha sp. (ex Lucinoma aequizonata)]MCU7896819.1 hypothetical protein [Candidatus Thiodiazotropha sp. (ex Lucinoma aequizonata)]MCU7898287.1 hypothetical protein [Candidatus Thiodiazotropha sp. (ex Lucinoma aequizonata)]MCU7903844.1 hypothetical protein [Candidatus Thiodiazotropha sp. (ex Lucinoma aequizonata)]MCU7912643.1 hypothetical protein [Candidatus Thiodiazotropha sp. (ex Lucinoma aequizonata)]
MKVETLWTVTLKKQDSEWKIIQLHFSSEFFNNPLVAAAEKKFKRVFDLVKDFGTSKSTKIDSIFDSLLCPDRPTYLTIPYYTSTASCSCSTPS